MASTRPPNAAAAASLAAKLRYLNDAAHLLHRDAPSTSSALGAAANDVGLRTSSSGSSLGFKAKDGGHGCGACGSILVPPLNCALELQGDKRSSGKRSRKHGGSERAGRRSKAQPLIVYTCGRCLRKTHVPLPASGAARRGGRGGIITKGETAANGVGHAGNAASDGGGGGAGSVGAANVSRADRVLSAGPSKSPGEAATDAAAEGKGADKKKRRAKTQNRSGLQAMLARSAAADAAKATRGLDLMDFMKTS